MLQAFLAELSDTPLLIPHLPKANLLNNLLEWVRKRIKGKLTPADHSTFSSHYTFKLVLYGHGHENIIIYITRRSDFRCETSRYVIIEINSPENTRI